MDDPLDQLRSYADAAAEAVPPTTLADVQTRRPWSRQPPWPIAIAAAAAAVALVGGLLALANEDSSPDRTVQADEPAPSSTTTAPSTSAPTSSALTTTVTSEPATPGTTPADPEGVTVQATVLTSTDRQVHCSGTPYPISAFDNPTGAEDDPDAAAAALRAWLEQDGFEFDRPRPQDGWRRMTAEPTRVTFGHGHPEAGDYLEVRAEDRGSGFTVTGWGGCLPRAFIEGRSTANFQLASANGSTVLLQAHEWACNGGRTLEDRGLTAQVFYGSASVEVLLTMTPLSGFHTCPLGDPTPVVVKLSEPLGNRGVLDLSTFPASNPSDGDPYH